jgi:hypothetical protein
MKYFGSTRSPVGAFTNSIVGAKNLFLSTTSGGVPRLTTGILGEPIFLGAS